jgi:glycine/D-amino acid oxidase-like deaminating enzyme
VLLLEQGRLTSGTTWHAAGLVGQMRPNRSMTGMSRYGIDLYSRLEAETGLATGWKQCGSLNVARTPERMQLLHKQAALARSFGVEVHVISPKPRPGEKLAADAHRRPAGRAVDPRRRQGQPDRPDHVLGQGRAQPRVPSWSKVCRSPASPSRTELPARAWPACTRCRTACRVWCAARR